MSNIRIKVKVGSNEIEIESPIEVMNDAIEYIPIILSKLNSERKENLTSNLIDSIPSIKIEKDDSLSDIILKLFKEEWGKSARKLSEVKSVLESYGLSYPKQSIAVTLMRLAQSGKLRRFKNNDNEYVYTASLQLNTLGE